MVLGRKEKALMNVIYKKASRSKNGQCLVTPLELLSKIPYGVDFKESDLEETLNQLSLDNYFECDRAHKSNGEPMYCITLKENGVSYLRDRKVSRRKLLIRIVTAILIAILGFVIKAILDVIF